MSQLNKENITVLLLCGGQGTRIKHLLDGLPKPMYNVLGRPFLDYQINYLKNFGLNNIVISAGYRADLMKEVYGNKHLIIEESEPLGTGGAVLYAMKSIETENIICLNGDTLFLLDFAKFVDFGISCGSKSSIALKEEADSTRFGSVLLEGKRINRFEEKNAGTPSGLINAGIYFLKKSQLQSFDFNQICSIEKDIFPTLVKDSLFGYVTDASFIDIGTPETLNEVESFIVNNKLTIS